MFILVGYGDVGELLVDSVCWVLDEVGLWVLVGVCVECGIYLLMEVLCIDVVLICLCDVKGEVIC